MLVSGRQGIMRFDVTYGAFRESCVLCVLAVWCCAVCFKRWTVRLYCFSSLPFPPFIGGFGKYWVGKYFHWLGQCNGVWWLVAALRVAMDTCPCPTQGSFLGSFLALVSPPTLTGTIPSSSIADEFNNKMATVLTSVARMECSPGCLRWNSTNSRRG